MARFRQHGGLGKALQLLESKNQKVLDVTLSILGNCCIEEKSKKFVSLSEKKIQI